MSTGLKRDLSAHDYQVVNDMFEKLSYPVTFSGDNTGAHWTSLLT